MPLPTPADIQRLMLETEAAKDALRLKCEELKEALALLREWPINDATAKPKPDRRREES